MDLVEIKLGCVEISGREDASEVNAVECCRDELSALRGKGGSVNVIEMPRARVGTRARALAV